MSVRWVKVPAGAVSRVGLSEACVLGGLAETVVVVAGFGAVVHYDDEPVAGESRGWNVKFYKVNKGKRHGDGAAVSSFWIHLEEWLRVNKGWVLTRGSDR